MKTGANQETLLIGRAPASRPTPTASMADLVLDAAAARQLVAVGDGDDDRWLEEKWIPSLKQKETKGAILDMQQHYIPNNTT